MRWYMDWTYILVLIGAIISAVASWNVNSTFRKYRKVRNSRGMTAEMAAQMILQDAGVYDVRIEHIGGNLTDHYSLNEKVLRLSDSVYGSASVAAIGVAAHECGHALQHAKGYAPLKLRSMAVPLANIGSRLSWPLMVLGLVLGWSGLLYTGIVLFTAVVFFQLITLPVELDASHRALRILGNRNMLYGNELGAAKKVLTAAALTYVAALFSAILQLLRLILLANNRRRN
ncbi:MAG: zinc metallopeptidase [Lachnospiraceae bacterium]|nr:zinc metallopeptidase [Lachnospiraceae bacterium]